MDELMGRGVDVGALLIFTVAWILYEPVLRRLARGRHVINADMVWIRKAWMGQMVRRPQLRLLDSQLVGHALNSATFFASSNLILIAGAAGVLFGSDGSATAIEATPLLAEGPPVLFSIKLGLLAIALARGFLSFIWAIRQLNYAVAVIGSAPLEAEDPRLDAFAEAAASVLNPALSAFNAGVRSYYFALAAAAWLFGPLPFIAVTLGAVSLLAWRQAASPAAKAVRRVRALLDEAPASVVQPDGPPPQS